MLVYVLAVAICTRSPQLASKTLRPHTCRLLHLNTGHYRQALLKFWGLEALPQILYYRAKFVLALRALVVAARRVSDGQQPFQHAVPHDGLEVTPSPQVPGVLPRPRAQDGKSAPRPRVPRRERLAVRALCEASGSEKRVCDSPVLCCRRAIERDADCQMVLTGLVKNVNTGDVVKD